MRSYIDDLNTLYSTRVFLKENVGLGPNAEDSENGAPMRKCLKCNQAAEDCECEWREEDAKSEDDMVFAKKGKHSDYDNEDDEFTHTGEHPEHKASNMAKQNLYRIAKMAAMLYDIIPCDSEIEPWVADKLSKATDNINSVLGYKDYEDFKHRVDHDIEIEEKTEQDLYKSIDAGGENLINKIKELMRSQPKERVEDAVYGMIKMLEA
jgi:hypothetical protein